LPHYSWIVDRFHVATAAFQRSQGREVDFTWLEDRLRPLGFHLVLCVRRPETFAAARAERLNVSGKPSQYDDLTVFVREQEVLREICGRSRLPLLEIDVSDDDVDRATERITDWMESTGGLWGRAP
jgi:hypothetical protein